jgi:hypothetical protein
MIKQKINGEQFKNLGIPSGKLGDMIERAGQVFIALAKAKVNVNTGNLRESIGYIERDNRGSKLAFRMIGARVYGGFKGYHAHLLEEGTSNRNASRKKKRKLTNKGRKLLPNIGPEKPFLQPAFDQGKTAFMASMEAQIKEYIENKAKGAGLQIKK